MNEQAPIPMIEFALDDADGNPHQYALLRHPATEGQEIMWALIGFGGEPLGAFIQSFVSGSKATSLKGLMDDPKVMKSIDFGGLGQGIAKSIGQTDMAALTAKLLRHVHRDNQQLREPVVFAAAFQGNYSELLKVLWEVVKHNRFLGL